MTLRIIATAYLIVSACHAHDYTIKRHGYGDMRLPENIKQYAQNHYDHVTQNPCCTSKIRLNLPKARHELENLGAQKITLKTADNCIIEAYHLSRGSSTLVISAGGFPTNKEVMVNSVALFERCDVILLDFRWIQPNYFRRQQTILHPVQTIILDCIKDVAAVLAYADQHGYRNIIGHGVCFGAGLFVLAQNQAQKDGTRTFDKLILDSCWLSLDAFADNIIKDPYLLWRWGKGGAPLVLKILTRICYLPVYGLCWLTLPAINIGDTLKHIHDTPILFLHGSADKLIPLDKFNRLWTCASHLPSIALVTPFEHSKNDKNMPALYAYLTNQFIEPEKDLQELFAF